MRNLNEHRVIGRRGVSASLAFIFIVAVIVTILPVMGYAQPPTCIVQTTKIASPDSDFLFPFTISADGLGFVFQLRSGSSFSTGFVPGAIVDVVELVPSGWGITDIECTSEQNAVIVEIENGVSIGCPGGIAVINCTFFNVRVASPIPTLSEWGMIAAAAGLMLVGVFFAMRRRRAAV